MTVQPGLVAADTNGMLELTYAAGAVCVALVAVASAWALAHAGELLR